MTLPCALVEQSFSQNSASFTGAKKDQKKLEAQAKRDARNKIKQGNLRAVQLDDCPNGCDRVNDAQLPHVYVVGRTWTRTPSGGSITVKVNFQYYLIYACGNH